MHTQDTQHTHVHMHSRTYMHTHARMGTYTERNQGSGAAAGGAGRRPPTSWNGTLEEGDAVSKGCRKQPEAAPTDHLKTRTTDYHPLRAQEATSPSTGEGVG